MVVEDVQSVMKEIASQVEQGASTRAVFGDPIEAGDRKVIPVAKVRWAGGGGGGGDTSGEGSGLGMALKGDPVGYIEVSPEGTQWHGVPDMSIPIKATIVVAVAAVLIMRGMRKYRKARRV